MGNPNQPCPKKNDSFHRSCQLPMAFQLRVGLVSSTFTVGILPGLTQCEPCVCFHSYCELMTTMTVSCPEDSEHLPSLWLLVFHTLLHDVLWTLGDRMDWYTCAISGWGVSSHYFQYFEQFWFSPRLETALIHKYKHSYLEDCWTIQPLTKQ